MLDGNKGKMEVLITPADIQKLENCVHREFFMLVVDVVETLDSSLG